MNDTTTNAPINAPATDALITNGLTLPNRPTERDAEREGKRDARSRTPSEDRMEAARATLADGLAAVRDDPGALARFLAFAARFRSYSARNQLLIYLQRPSARHCMGYRAWQDHSRQVRRGERGLTVLAPLTRRPTAEEIADGTDPDGRVVFGYRATVTFDYEQTDAVRDDALVYEPPVPRLEADGPEGLALRLERTASSIGYAVETAETGYADGWCRFRERTIRVRPGLSPADRAAVLAHELAHALAHVPATTPVKASVSKASMELQAEGAAYVALAALGLDTGRASLPYLKGWADGDDDALAAELAAIDRIAGRLLALIEAAGPAA